MDSTGKGLAESGKELADILGGMLRVSVMSSLNASGAVGDDLLDNKLFERCKDFLGGNVRFH
jgi:hypothetical protein